MRYRTGPLMEKQVEEITDSFRMSETVPHLFSGSDIEMGLYRGQRVLRGGANRGPWHFASVGIATDLN